MTYFHRVPENLLLGKDIREKVPEADQVRQRRTVDEIIRRFERQPGVILADEVGMGKTFVALAVAYTAAMRPGVFPVVVMVPSGLVAKWQSDLATFCALYVANCNPIAIGEPASTPRELSKPSAFRHAVAKDGISFLRLLDDPKAIRAHIIFVTHQAMSRQRMDKWVNLCLIAEALRRHARGRGRTLINVKSSIHRFIGDLAGMLAEQRAHKDGEGLWQTLLREDPAAWRDVYNAGVSRQDGRLADDPIPKGILDVLPKMELSDLASALASMPVRASGGAGRVEDRLDVVRTNLRIVEKRLWSQVLVYARWRSPLLIMDEAHHLKNSSTKLARQFTFTDPEDDIRSGDGALAKSFERMLFLTATPFQLGHRELVNVLSRFGNAHWDATAFGDHNNFDAILCDLGASLDESQRASIELQKSWARIPRDELPTTAEGMDRWWSELREHPVNQISLHLQPFVKSYDQAVVARKRAEGLLRPWILRDNKGDHWANSVIRRRDRREGRGIMPDDLGEGVGLTIPDDQLLSFYLAARAAVNPHKDLLGEALCSSYEAFRKTRADRVVDEDVGDDPDRAERAVESDEILQNSWYLAQFDESLQGAREASHPKIYATVQRVADLWERGEKVVVFAFYRQTCRALRLHINEEIKRRMALRAAARFGCNFESKDSAAVSDSFQKMQARYFDAGSPMRRAIDSALTEIVSPAIPSQSVANQIAHKDLVSIMRRFLRVPTTLATCFPSERSAVHRTPEMMTREFLDYRDASGMSWREKFTSFSQFLFSSDNQTEREGCMDALKNIKTGKILGVMGNIRECTGQTAMEERVRLMRAFNTPFFPDILVCSEVMSEGVDLHRFCRHVIHHDLAWNPSTIEQRTGRIDRIGCKAEGRHSVVTFLPYITGAADERQFQVMRDREQWFQVLMGQDVVADLINAQTTEDRPPLPLALTASLAFGLSL
jgi:superfamily II DNA or RNA helicase